MRKGQNPAKMGLPAYRPKRLGLAVLSYIPSQEGYFAQALDILKYQIASLHKTTRDFDLLVFDNGSCAEVQNELRRLQEANLIHFLVLSNYNVGKTGALNWLFSAMPNELIGYADSDVLFYPGWFENTLDLIEAFPQAGMVTAQPIFFDALRGDGSAYRSLEQQPRYQLTQEHFSGDIIERYTDDVNLDPDEIQKYKEAAYPVAADHLTGRRALLLSSHMQFVVRSEVARQVVPLPVSMGLNRKDTIWLDRHIDQAGFLHLSTMDFYVRHIGNYLDSQAMKDVQRLSLDDIVGRSSGSHPTHSLVKPLNTNKLQFLNRLGRLPLFRNLLRRLYNLLFEYFAQ